jgi:apolipoprotein N-acyltransferase
LLLWLAFFPANLGALGFIALVPWLALVITATSTRRRYLITYLAALLFSALATQWVRVAHPMMYLAWLAFALVLPLFWLATLAAIRALAIRQVPLALALPVALIIVDYVRAHFPTGFPFLQLFGWQHHIGFGWYFLGYTQHAFLPFIQSADVGGVYLVSACTAAINGLLADLLFSCSRFRRQWPIDPRVPPLSLRCRRITTILVASLTATNLLYGFYRLHHLPFSPGPRVAALQGNIPQNIKNDRGDTLIRTYRDLHNQALELQPLPDLIIWPETCCPVDYCQIATGESPDPNFALYAQRTQAIFQRFQPGVPTLLGLNTLVWRHGREWKYNSALLLLPGHQRFGPRYDKIHLVPFGEYVPFGETFPFLRHFTPYPYDYSCVPGQSWTRFRLPDSSGHTWSFGCLICYEDTDPDLARRYLTDYDPVHFLVNLSNDGWFDGSEEHEQHLAICRFRAIETRRCVVRAVNMGISAVIDSDGRIIALPAPTWSTSKKIEAVLTAEIPIDNRMALYPHWGDTFIVLALLAWSCLILLPPTPAACLPANNSAHA